jgi:hypothetical protein
MEGRMKGVRCNKCNRFLTYEMLNDTEAEELKKEGNFVCSDCINNEMKDYCDSCEEYIDQVDLGDGEFGCPLCRKTDITTFYRGDE